MKTVRLSEQQVHEILVGRLNRVEIRARQNCKYLTKYFEDMDYISNVLSGCGLPVHYDKISPYGQKDDLVQVKNTETILKITNVRVNEEKLTWVLFLEAA